MNEGNHEEGQTPAPMDRGIPRVLVIAPPPVDRELRERIESAGMLARGLREVGDAAEVAVSWKPHAVIVDAEIQDPPAPEIFHRLRKVHPCIAVLFAGAPSGDVVTLADRAGADSILIGPLDP